MKEFIYLEKNYYKNPHDLKNILNKVISSHLNNNNNEINYSLYIEKFIKILEKYIKSQDYIGNIEFYYQNLLYLTIFANKLFQNQKDYSKILKIYIKIIKLYVREENIVIKEDFILDSNNTQILLLINIISSIFSKKNFFKEICIEFLKEIKNIENNNLFEWIIVEIDNLTKYLKEEEIISLINSLFKNFLQENTLKRLNIFNFIFILLKNFIKKYILENKNNYSDVLLCNGVFETINSCLAESLDFININELKDNIKKYIKLSQSIEMLFTTGGKLHLNIKDKKQIKILKRFASILSMNVQEHNWATGEESLEIHFLPSHSYHYLKNILTFFIKSNILDYLNILEDKFYINTQNDELLVKYTWIPIQQSLKVDGIFWNEKDILVEEARILVIILIILLPYDLKFTLEIKNNIDTWGPLVEGGGIIYNEKGIKIGNNKYKDRADIWGILFITKEDIEMQRKYNKDYYSYIMEVYHLIGNLIIYYLFHKRKEYSIFCEKNKEFKKAFIKIAENFLEEIKSIFVKKNIKEIFEDSYWKKKEWEKLRNLLIKVQKIKKTASIFENNENFSYDIHKIVIQTLISIKELLIREFIKNNRDNDYIDNLIYTGLNLWKLEPQYLFFTKIKLNLEKE